MLASLRVPLSIRSNIRSLLFRAVSQSRKCFLSTTATAAAAASAAPTSPQVAPASMLISELLLRKRQVDQEYVIAESAPLRSAVSVTARLGSLFALMVVADGPGKAVTGIITTKDLLRALDANGGNLDLPVGPWATPSSLVVHVGPSDTVGSASLLMSELGVAHLPVVDRSRGEVLGIVSVQDIANLATEGTRGGKAAAVLSVLPRRGIAAATRISDSAAPSSVHGAAAGASRRRPLFLCTGHAELARVQRRAAPKPSEDALFVMHVLWPPAAAESTGAAAAAAAVGAAGGSRPLAAPPPPPRAVTYMGVADGVGSWHQFGVDPAQYSRRLVAACEEYVWRCAAGGGPPPQTLEVLTAGWEAVQSGGVVGSCTATVLSLDSARNQLSVSGVGDCGVLLLRGSTEAGSSCSAPSEWRVSARATQQLKGFNRPFQLGYAPGHEDKFEKPWQGETLVLPARDGDLVVAATDGLFDNLDEADILRVVEAWAKRGGGVSAGSRGTEAEGRGEMEGLGIAAAAATDASNSSRSSSAPLLMDGGSASVQALAAALASAACEASGDRMRDGPFARLAKENDVLWTQGGRPDDISVAVAHVSARPPMRAAPAAELQRVAALQAVLAAAASPSVVSDESGSYIARAVRASAAGVA